MEAFTSNADLANAAAESIEAFADRASHAVFIPITCADAEVPIGAGKAFAGRRARSSTFLGCAVALDDVVGSWSVQSFANRGGTRANAIAQ